VDTAQAARRKDSSFLPFLPCPACKSNLLVSCFQDSFLLLCRCGHQFDPNDAAAAPSPEWTAGAASLLEAWELRLAKLRSLAAEAWSKGYENVALVFDRSIRNLEARVQRLRGIARPPSTSGSLPVPNGG
jgi:hypothetical protein